MPIRENDPYGIVPDGFHGGDVDVPLTRDRLLLAESVTLYFCTRTLDPQILGWE